MYPLEFQESLSFRARPQFTKVNCHHPLVEFPNVAPSVAVTLQRQDPLLPESKVQDEFGSPATVISGSGCHPDPASMSLSTTYPVAPGTGFQASVVIRG